MMLFNTIYEVWHCYACNPVSKEIKNYNYTPNSWHFKEEKYEITDKKEVGNKVFPLYIGMELEVEPYDRDPNRVLSYATNFRNFLTGLNVHKMFYFKHDGSVQGFEIVTHPFSLKYAKNLELRKILEWLTKEQYTSYSNGRCGLHIHLDKNYFNHFDIIKLRMFFSRNQKQIKIFSKRDGCNTKYCGIEEFSLKNFLYGGQEGRYWALNMNTGKNTIEIRIFRGTLDYARLIASMQFCEAVALFVKTVGIGYISKQISWEYFIEWAKTRGRWKLFTDYLNSDKINWKGEK